MAALVPNAFSLYKSGAFSGSALQCIEEECLAGLLLSADNPLTWEEICSAAKTLDPDGIFFNNPLGRINALRSLQNMLNKQYVQIIGKDSFKATVALKEILRP
jgi:hypothetical protein